MTPESAFRLAADALFAAFVLFPQAQDAPRFRRFLLLAIGPLPLLLLLSAPAGLWMSDFLRAAAVLAGAAAISAYLLARIPRGWRPVWVLAAVAILLVPVLAAPVPALGIDPDWSPLVLADGNFRPAPVERAKDWAAASTGATGPLGWGLVSPGASDTLGSWPAKLADPFPTLEWPAADRWIALAFALLYGAGFLSLFRRGASAWRMAVAFWLLSFIGAFAIGPGRGTAVAQTLILRPDKDLTDLTVDLVAVSVRRPGEVLRFLLPAGNWQRLPGEVAPPRQPAILALTPEHVVHWPFRRDGLALFVCEVQAQLWPGERLVLARQELRLEEDDGWHPAGLPRVRHLGSYRGLGIPMSER